MGYCTQVNVEAEFKAITFDADTTVTATELAEFISQADALIDSIIGNKYVVPLTGATSLLVLKYISTLLVSDRVRKVIAVRTPVGDKNQDGVRGEYKTAMDFLDKIVNGELRLDGELWITTTGGFNDYVSENGITPIFDVTKDQW